MFDWLNRVSYEDDPRTGGFFYVSPGKTLNSSHTSLGGTFVGVFGFVLSSFWFFHFFFIPQPAEYRAEELALDTVPTVGLVRELTQGVMCGLVETPGAGREPSRAVPHGTLFWSRWRHSTGGSRCALRLRCVRGGCSGSDDGWRFGQLQINTLRVVYEKGSNKSFVITM